MFGKRNTLHVSGTSFDIQKDPQFFYNLLCPKKREEKWSLQLCKRIVAWNLIFHYGILKRKRWLFKKSVQNDLHKKKHVRDVMSWRQNRKK